MPKHLYKSILVMCLNSRTFPITELRQAVDHLRSIPDAKGNFIVAETSVRAGQYRLRAMAALRLDQIKGKTPAEVWNLFDNDVDRQIQSLGTFKASV